MIHPRTMKMIMYTKGADAAVFGRLRNSQSKEEDELRATTLEHVSLKCLVLVVFLQILLIA